MRDYMARRRAAAKIKPVRTYEPRSLSESEAVKQVGLVKQVNPVKQVEPVKQVDRVKQVNPVKQVNLDPQQKARVVKIWKARKASSLEAERQGFTQRLNEIAAKAGLTMEEIEEICEGPKANT